MWISKEESVTLYMYKCVHTSCLGAMADQTMEVPDYVYYYV